MSEQLAEKPEDHIDELEIEPDRPRPRIPDGVYQMKLVKYEAELSRMFGGEPRLFAHFEIVEPGPYLGVRIYGSWRLAAIIRANGKTRMRVRPRSDLHTMLVSLCGPSARADRISLASLRDRVLTVKTRTVTHNRRQRRYHESMQYSVVSDIIEIVAG